MAAASTRLPVGTSLSSDVVIAQVRSMVVDLLELTGLDPDASRRMVPPAEGNGRRPTLDR